MAEISGEARRRLQWRSGLTLAALILAPAFVLAWESSLLTLFRPAPDQKLVLAIDALRKGAAHFRCEAPFDRALQHASSGVDCQIAGGERVLVFETPGQDDAIARATLTFDPRYAQRFSGRRVRIDLAGVCESCPRGVLVRLTPQPGDLGEWTRLGFAPGAGVESVEIAFPDLDIDAVEVGPRIEISAPGADLRFRLEAVTVYEAGDV